MKYLALILRDFKSSGLSYRTGFASIRRKKIVKQDGFWLKEKLLGFLFYVNGHVLSELFHSVDFFRMNYKINTHCKDPE